jgi:DMSO reductase anchor subunit
MTEEALFIAVLLVIVSSIVCGTLLWTARRLHNEAKREERQQYPVPDYPGACRSFRNLLLVIAYFIVTLTGFAIRLCFTI